MFIFLIRRGLSSNSKLYTFRVSFLMSQQCRRPTDLQKHEKFNIVHVSIPSYMTPLGCAKIPRFSSFTSFSHHRKCQRLTKSLFCYFYMKNFNCLKYRHIVRLLHIVRSIWNKSYMNHESWSGQHLFKIQICINLLQHPKSMTQIQHPSICSITRCSIFLNLVKIKLI